MSTSASPAKARHSRLGKGLSSLMAHPVQIHPEIPAAMAPVPPVAPAAPAVNPPAESASRSAAAPANSSAKSLPGTPGNPRAGSPGKSPASAAGAPGTQVTGPVRAGDGDSATGDGVVHLPIGSIVANPFQPRQRFEPAALKSLAESIKAQGVMQPVIVRPPARPGSDSTAATRGGKPGTYEIVAGERRWRAAQMAGLARIPALVRNLDDRQIAEWALVENLQREDLNPIERAKAFQNLMQQFHLSQDQIAGRVGVERSTIANSLRLLGLHKDVQLMIQEGLLSAGQAKALAGLPDGQLQVSVAQRAVKGDWSVRQVESAVRNLLLHRPEHIPAPSLSAPAKPRAAHLADLEEQIGRQLQTRVHIRPARKKGAGTLAIEFYSLDQFDALLSRLGVQAGE